MSGKRQFSHKISAIFNSLKQGKPVWIWILGIVVALNLLATFFVGLLFLSGNGIWWMIDSVPQAPRRAAEAALDWVREIPYIHYQFMSDGLPRYELIIAKPDYERLLEGLPTSINQFLHQDNKVKVSALLKFEGKEYQVKVNFRGDGSGHWFWPKKSWRIELSGKDSIDGMQEVDFTVPDQRQYFTEAFNNYRARKLGLAVPKDGWGILYVNGIKQGVYFMSESWGTSLLSRSGLSEKSNLYGDKNPPSTTDPFTIFGKFSDITDKWKTYVKNESEQGTVFKKRDNPSQEVIDASTPDVSFTDLAELFRVVESDDAYFKKNIWNIIDKEGFFAWFTQAKLSGSYHQYSMLNARFYFDPNIGKFRPLPIDVRMGVDALPYFFLGATPLMDRLNHDPDFVTEMETYLYAYVSDEKNLADDLAHYDELYKKLRIAFYKDHYDEFTADVFDAQVMRDRQYIIDNSRSIRETIEKAEARTVISLHVPASENHLQSKPIPASFDVVEISAAPVRLAGVKITGDISGNAALSLYRDTNGNEILDGGDKYVGFFQYDGAGKKYLANNLDERFYPTLKILPFEKYRDVGHLDSLEKIYTIEPTNTRFFVAGTASSGRFRVTPILENVITKKPIPINGETYIDREIFSGFDSISATIDQFLAQNSQFFKIDQNTVGIFGIHEINKTIVVPKGLTVSISPGARLVFSPGVSLFSYSRIVALGTALAPVSFVRGDSGRAWGAVSIIDVPVQSEFDHAVFDGGSTTVQNGVYVHGMLAAHYSDIIVKNSLFSRASGDDALGIINASSTITKNVFTSNNSDAIDIDLGRYSFVSGNRIEKSGGDGIDLDGVVGASLLNNFISKSGDRCISVGERSEKPLMVDNVTTECKPVQSE